MERVSSKTLSPYVGRVSLGAPPTLLEGPIAPLREAQPTERCHYNLSDPGVHHAKYDRTVKCKSNH